MARTLVGIVSATKSQKTITVKVQSRKTHPLYLKQYTSTRKFRVHDEDEEAGVGDKVEIISVNPISKTKTWSLSKVLRKSHGSEGNK